MGVIAAFVHYADPVTVVAVIMLLATNPCAKARSLPPGQEVEELETKESDHERIFGDMILNKVQVEGLENLRDNNNARLQAWAWHPEQLWPNKQVPYVIDSTFRTAPYSYIGDEVLLAIKEYNTKTCIRFTEHSGESDYVVFVLGQTCQSHIGRQGGPQLIELSLDCYDKTNAIHEMMHALGRFHEHQRPDRDTYIQVLWKNVQGGMRNENFHVLPPDAAMLVALYDIHSIMHYPWWAHSANGQPTIVPNDPSIPLSEIGRQPPTGSFTQLDIDNINIIYGCS